MYVILYIPLKSEVTYSCDMDVVVDDPPVRLAYIMVVVETINRQYLTRRAKVFMIINQPRITFYMFLPVEPRHIQFLCTDLMNPMRWPLIEMNKEENNEENIKWGIDHIFHDLLKLFNGLFVSMMVFQEYTVIGSCIGM